MTEETNKPAAEPQKSDRAAKWLFAGTAAVALAAAFVLVARPPAPPLPDDVALQQAIGTHENLHPAFTKDSKAIRVYLDIARLDRGTKYNDDTAFKTALHSQATLSLMSETMKYTDAEIPANIGKIQQAVSASLAQNVQVGTAADGSRIMAKEGVNFGAPKIDRVTDARGENVLYRADILPGNTPIFRFGT